jgi:ankyrin repeat protein
MKHILVYCQNTFKDHVIGAYFFNARGSKLEKTFLGMLHSLIYQLLEQDLLRELFIPMYLDKRKKHQKWEWNEGELKNFLLSESKKCRPKPVVLLVDALDECDEADVRRVVSFLESLSTNAVNAKARFNICLSSRHYPNISMGKNLELIVEDRKEHDEDIARYIQHKLKGKDKEVEEEVRRKASGIFMWVILVVEMLNQAFDEGKIRAIREKLREVPSDLEEMFRTLLDKDNRDKELTILMLQWVLFATRPLKPEELYFAVLAGTKTQGLEAWDQSKDTREVIQRFITSSSKGLIEVREGHAETVQFIHQSVNDFLLRNKRLQTLDPALDSNPIYISHDKLRACCISYIMVGEPNPLAKDRSAEELNDNYPFLNYASTYLLHHAEKAQAGCITQETLVQWLQRPDGGFERLKSFRNTFEKDYKFRYNTGVELLYALSLHGYCELARIVLLEKGTDVNAQGGLYGNALQAASVQGKGKTVEMLLEKGADVNAQGGLYGNALQAASAQGEKEIVAMLLEKGADVNAQDRFLGSALRAPLAKEERRLLAALRWAALIWAASIWAALRWAASIWANQCSGGAHNGLQEETEVDSEARICDIALGLAAEKGKEEIVTILLEKGADVDAQGGFWGNALLLAVAEGKKEIVRMLLERRADINDQGEVRGISLPAALAEEYEEILKLFLKKQANINT